MKTTHFNKLSEAELERLAILAEECAEVIKAIMKIQRHGYESYNPDKPYSKTNRQDLEIKLGHIAYAAMMLETGGDVDPTAVREAMAIKKETIQQYLHHQQDEEKFCQVCGALSGREPFCDEHTPQEDMS